MQDPLLGNPTLAARDSLTWGISGPKHPPPPHLPLVCPLDLGQKEKRQVKDPVWSRPCRRLSGLPTQAEAGRAGTAEAELAAAPQLLSQPWVCSSSVV